MFDRSIVLNNGVKIPQLGLGTWLIDDNKAADVVKAAVKIGYRHIDTAQAYGNERGVGEGVRTCVFRVRSCLLYQRLRQNIRLMRKRWQESMRRLKRWDWIILI